MCQMTSYTCLISRGVNSNCNTFIIFAHLVKSVLRFAIYTNLFALIMCEAVFAVNSW